MGRECLHDMAEAMEQQGQEMWVGGIRVVTRGERAKRERHGALEGRLTAAEGQGGAEQQGSNWEEMLEEEAELLQELAAVEEEEAGLQQGIAAVEEEMGWGAMEEVEGG